MVPGPAAENSSDEAIHLALRMERKEILTVWASAVLCLLVSEPEEIPSLLSVLI